MSTCMLTHNIPDGSNVQSMLKSKVLGLLAIYLYIIYIYTLHTYVQYMISIHIATLMSECTHFVVPVGGRIQYHIGIYWL